MTKSKIFLYFCLFFIGGVFVSSFLKVPLILILTISIFGILLISVFWPYKEFAVIGFCIIFLVLGIWRHKLVLSKIENSEIKNFIEKEVILTGLVGSEPSIKEKTQKLTIQITEIKQNENVSRKIKGKVLVTTWRYPEYQYGDVIKTEGTLEEPPVFKDFNYKDYLIKDRILAVMYFPEIELVEKNQGNFLKKALISSRQKLEESLNRVLSRPYSGILEALLFGKEENISERWKEKLNLTGTRHIAAVSGMNITILTFLILNFLLMFGFWHQQAFYFSIILIFFYILMIGAPASAIRAGIMAGILLLAQHFGRFSSPFRAIVFAATLMLIKNPLLLRLDIGFQLSFLAVMGLIYLQPILSEKFQKIPNAWQLRNNLIATFSAQIFALPILIYNFGQISIISPVINILILPLIPLLTILGFVFAFAGIFWQQLAQIISWPTWLGLTYILKIVNLSSKIPFASLTLENVHWILVIIFYAILGSFIFWLNQKRKLKFLQY